MGSYWFLVDVRGSAGLFEESREDSPEEAFEICVGTLHHEDFGNPNPYHVDP